MSSSAFPKKVTKSVFACYISFCHGGETRNNKQEGRKKTSVGDQRKESRKGLPNDGVELGMPSRGIVSSVFTEQTHPLPKGCRVHQSYIFIIFIIVLISVILVF